MAQISTFEKYIFLLEEFERRQNKTLDAYDEVLLYELNLSPKQLGRLLDELKQHFDNIEKFKNGKKNIYKLIKPIDIFTEAFKNSNEIGWLLQMAHEGDPEIFKDLEKLTKKDKHLYMFKNTPFEDISNLESKQSFSRLKRIIEAREYAKLTFMYDETVYDNLKCLKLVFMDNNWYVAYADSEDKLRFGRISFIKRVDFGSRVGHFQPSSVQKHLNFLENEVQNSMTLYGVEKKVATLKALTPIAKYFKKDMKKFLTSQTFLEELADGSILFSVTYTQELEILPFVQKWLPDLIILEPQELKEAYEKKLQNGIKNLSNK
ncbi:WYL domain-containing protein [Sulfurimonas hydrogeniphila]|uniref:WYL domain-containing protein n=1 Tax=Sulfurimonas hydrogeniphila TaxID=2509341 RepID=UPI00125FB424|nr:WYL domain-containing protein [Sulfurimonas hydrogeniphila]